MEPNLPTKGGREKGHLDGGPSGLEGKRTTPTKPAAFFLCVLLRMPSWFVLKWRPTRGQPFPGCPCPDFEKQHLCS